MVLDATLVATNIARGRASPSLPGRFSEAPTAAHDDSPRSSRDPSGDELPYCPADCFRMCGTTHGYHHRTRGRSSSCDSDVSCSRSPTPREYSSQYHIVADVFVAVGSEKICSSACKTASRRSSGVIGPRVSRSSTRSPRRRSWSRRLSATPPPRIARTSQGAELNLLTVARACRLPRRLGDSCTENIWPRRLVAYQLPCGSDWRVFGPTNQTFRWVPADETSVSECKKSSVRASLQKYACEHSVNVCGHGFVRIALKDGNFWISFQGGVAYAGIIK